MIGFRTLGGLALTAEDGSEHGFTRRRALALLAVLAVAAPDAVPRDKLLGWLWPEADDEHGRNVLNQTLFTIRRGLARPDVILGRTDLRLNLDVIACDVSRFIAAFNRGNHREAVDVYAGPFLDGFFLSEAPEFERWVDETRTRLARRVLASLRLLAENAESEGDLRAAAEFRWRITEVDPLDSAAALALVRTLAAAGDRTRALRFARHHEALLREEIGSGVDSELSHVVTRLLADGEALPALPGRDDSAGPLSRRGMLQGGASEVLEAVTLAPNGHQSATRQLRPRRTVVGAVAALVLASGAVGWWSSPRARHTSASGSDVEVVAVMPFDVRGAADTRYLRDGMVELLSRAVDGAGNLRAVDSRLLLRTMPGDSVATNVEHSAAVAGRLNASRFVIGDVVATGTSLRIAASLYQRRGSIRLLASASVDGTPEELLPMVDRLASQLLASQPSTGRPRATDVAALSTSSLPALKAYLSGQNFRRAGRYAEALEAFQRAVREDSTFALAWYGLSNVADWASRGDLVMPAARQASRWGSRLTEHDRLMVQAHLAWREARSDSAERLYQLLLHAYPDDGEGWYQLGELYFHDNSRRGRSFADAREPFERVRALEPGDREALTHLVRIALRSGDEQAIDSLTALAMRENPGPAGIELRAVRAFGLRDSAAEAASLRELAAADGPTLSNVAWRVSVYALSLDGAERILRLGMNRGRPTSMEVSVRGTLALVLMGEGRIRESIEQMDWLERAGGVGAMTARIARAELSLAPGVAVDASTRARALSALDSAVSVSLARGTAADTGDALVQACLAGMLAVESGQDQPAVRLARVLGEARSDLAVQLGAHDCERGIRARMALKAGRLNAGLDSLLAVRAGRVPVGTTAEVLDRYLIAEMLFAMRRDVEATAWYESIAQRGMDELLFLAPAEQRLGELAERRGDTDTAARHRALAARVWSRSDAGLPGQVARVARDALMPPAIGANKVTRGRRASSPRPQ